MISEEKEFGAEIFKRKPQRESCKTLLIRWFYYEQIVQTMNKDTNYDLNPGQIGWYFPNPQCVCDPPCFVRQFTLKAILRKK